MIFDIDKIKGYLNKDGLLKGLNYVVSRRRLFLSIVLIVAVSNSFHFLNYVYGQFKQEIPMILMIKAKALGMEVGVQSVTKQTIPVYLNYVGTTSSVRKVDIRARVKGFLTEQHFKEGDDVKEGDLMFVIDESPFKASVDEITAQLEQDKAKLDFANEQVERYKKLVDKEYVSKESYDSYVTQAKAAKAIVDADTANLEKANLDLGYCRMYSPLNGRVGRIIVHTGNLVGANDETVLATVVQLDPMYVYFYPSEQQYRQIVEFQKKNKLVVELGFSDGTKYPNKGEVDFIDNSANQQTNTIAMRGVFPNPDKVLLPDVYVNVNLLLDQQADTLVVPQKAIMQGQEGPHVYVVDDKGVVKEKVLEIQFNYDGMAAVKSGVAEGDKVIVDGIQKVRPGMKVRTTDVR